MEGHELRVRIRRAQSVQMLADVVWRMYNIHITLMPKKEMPAGSLTLLILRVLNAGPLHGYAIAQRIHSLSCEVLQVEEGAPLSGSAKAASEGLGDLGVGHL